MQDTALLPIAAQPRAADMQTEAIDRCALGGIMAAIMRAFLQY